jgi:hypothetical protein
MPGAGGSRRNIILIETLSTNADKPAPPAPQLAEFYALLEGEYGFRKEVADTTYRFESKERPWI